MARIIVTPDESSTDATSALLDERVYSVHLNSDHGARQLLERLSWAIADAESPGRERRRGPERGRVRGVSAPEPVATAS